MVSGTFLVTVGGCWSCVRWSLVVSDHCGHMGPHLGDPFPMGTFFSFWVPISVPRSPFSLIWAEERMKSLYSHYLMFTI